MNQTEMLKKLSGSFEDKKELFDILLEKAISGSIEDSETAMLEFLKLNLIKQEVIVGELSATMKGTSGIQ